MLQAHQVAQWQARLRRGSPHLQVVALAFHALTCWDLHTLPMCQVIHTLCQRKAEVERVSNCRSGLITLPVLARLVTGSKYSSFACTQDSITSVLRSPCANRSTSTVLTALFKAVSIHLTIHEFALPQVLLTYQHRFGPLFTPTVSHSL